MYLQSSLGAEVDITKIGLWGTSFAGGHVLVTAAKEGTNVTAVVSQVSLVITTFCILFWCLTGPTLALCRYFRRCWLISRHACGS